MTTDKTLVPFRVWQFPKHFHIPKFSTRFLAADPWTIACPCRNCLSNLFPGRSYHVAILTRKGSKFKAKLGEGGSKEKEGGASFLPSVSLHLYDLSGCDFDRTTF